MGTYVNGMPIPATTPQASGYDEMVAAIAAASLPDAACVDVGEERRDAIFFPLSSDPAAYDEGKSICATCIERDACLDIAMTAEGTVGAQARFGLFGGLDPDERAEKAGRKPRSLRARTSHRHDDMPPRPESERTTCGTRSGYMAHYRHGETPCEPCKVARRKYGRVVDEKRREKRKAAPRRFGPLAPPTSDDRCGTRAGYDRHRRVLEVACQPCKDASVSRLRKAKQQSKEVAQQAKNRKAAAAYRARKKATRDEVAA